MSKSFAVVVLFVIAFALQSCAPGGGGRQRPVESTMTEPQFIDLEHVVRFRGETLGLISRWYTGSVNNWRMIVDANPGLRPEAINIGQVIVIPGEIVVERLPLTEDVIARNRSAEPSSKNKADELMEEILEAEDTTDEPVVPADATAEPVVEDKTDDMAAQDAGEVEEPQAVAGDDAAPTMPDEPTGAAAVDEPAGDEAAPEPEADEREKLLEELLGE